MNYSPLRYPGGKSKLAPYLKRAIKKQRNSKLVYIEPFAGGAGVALDLLINNAVDEIVINDYDKAIYSFWRAVKEDPQYLIKLIQETPITIKEWTKQKEIYLKGSKYSVELGFAAFFLNRTNRSGILNAGPIGGMEQKGNYKIDARFNKTDLIKRIQQVVKYRDKIVVYNKEIRSLLNKILPRYCNQLDRYVFVYFDPPYYVKGQRLYPNFFEHEDHVQIAKLIKESYGYDWIVTYDDVESIRTLYSEYPQWQFELSYSLSSRKQGKEVMIFKNNNLKEMVRYSK